MTRAKKTATTTSTRRALVSAKLSQPLPPEKKLSTMEARQLDMAVADVTLPPLASPVEVAERGKQIRSEIEKLDLPPLVPEVSNGLDEDALEMEDRLTENLIADGQLPDEVSKFVESELVEFRNATDLKFSDISSERFRTYTFADGFKVTIDEPLKLHASASGGHRLFDTAGVCHYIPAGWRHLTWTVKPGKPHFDL